MGKRYYKVPPLRINTTVFMADTAHLSNEKFGILVRKMITDWREKKGKWVRRGSLSEYLRTEIFNRDGSVCRYCGDAEGPHEIDHIVPVSLGGTDDRSNLCVSCRRCNRDKSDKMLNEWRGAA